MSLTEMVGQMGWVGGWFLRLFLVFIDVFALISWGLETQKPPAIRLMFDGFGAFESNIKLNVD